MKRQVLASLLRNLLDLIRLWARRSFHCLLRIFSALSFRFRASSRPVIRDDSKDTKQIRHDFSENLSAGPVFLACSLKPKRPPPARTNTRQATLDSFGTGTGRTCSSPTTIYREPSGMRSPTSYSIDNQRNSILELPSPRESSTLQESPGPLSLSSPCTMDNQANMTQESPSSPEVLAAEPAGLLAPPSKDMKSMKSYLPSETSKYDRNIPIKSNMGPFEFDSLETVTVYREPEVSEWSHYVQPEGQPYYRHTSKRFRCMAFLTDENLCDDAILNEASHFVAAFERRVEKDPKLPYDLNLEVAFEIRPDGWFYYMVDLDNRYIFWLDKYIIDDHILPLNFGVEHRDYLRHIFDREYWLHIEYFPNHRALQEGLLEEVLGILSQLHIDVITSVDSTCSFSDGELRLLIGLVKNLQSLRTSECAKSYVVHSSARIIGLLVYERFFNFFGFHGARLSNWQSVRGPNEKKRSLLITLLSPVLFYAPEVHLAALDRVWVDNVVKHRLWEAFQSKIERDWEGFILYATVLVTANVSFLAIPSVLTNQLDNRLMTSPSAVLSQLSVVFSLGSIIIGLLLVRQMRVGAKESTQDHLEFLKHRNHERIGFETLAILFSLPYALLMWGMATFLAAVVIICFYALGENTPWGRRIIYAVAWLFVVILIVWTILVGWEKKNRTDLSSPSAVFSFPPFKVKSWVRKLNPEEMELKTFATTITRSFGSIRAHRSSQAPSTGSSTLADSSSSNSINRSWPSRSRSGKSRWSWWGGKSAASEASV